MVLHRALASLLEQSPTDMGVFATLQRGKLATGSSPRLHPYLSRRCRKDGYGLLVLGLCNKASVDDALQSLSPRVLDRAQATP